MFDSLLIANRGEIACRVIRTARRMGIRTIAVYSDADKNARHVRMADEAVHIGAAPARESYLLMDRIFDAARQTGAKAIHPGYGFLSENAEFAEACARNGLIFVGPPASAIRAMGLKDAAKKLMEDAGVPVVPGYHGDNQDDAHLAKEAEKIGYPVLIKAVAGGGGKGMRRVDDAKDFASALEGARREAKAAFGNDAVLIEKYILKPRHIEIQVFGDSHGNAVHLFERDCSLQRRHQKVVEEAPAPNMPETLRRAMGEAAVKAARAIAYEGAGTIEFIVDVSQGIDSAAFYFMEMNTRLQVEHPVTECVTGQDLVEWQLRVAAGEPLPKTQDQLSLSGHAIEVRIYAEDPLKGFLPSTGKLTHLSFPDEDDHVRIDTGVNDGDEVTMHYDPIIAKLIVRDHDRQTAIRRMSQALSRCAIAGLTSNIGFLKSVMAHPAFIAGDLDTGFIDRHQDALLPKKAGPGDDILALATLDHMLGLRDQYAQEARASGDPYSPWASADGWRLNGETQTLLHFNDGTDAHVVKVTYKRDGYHLTLPGSELDASATRAGDNVVVANLGTRRVTATVISHGRDITVIRDGDATRLSFIEPGFDTDDQGASGGGIIAPMPGKVTKVSVREGEKVTKGTVLLILEAMKMEHSMTAPMDGIVQKLAVAEGDQVSEGTTLVVVDAGEGEGGKK